LQNDTDMALIVQKYGGTSVATPELIRRAAARVVAARRSGDALLVVVSAMGHTTDELLELARSVSPDPVKRHPREVDMLLTTGERVSMALLAMAVRDLGVEAVSLTGSQAAIITDDAHTVARIEEIRGGRVREELDAGRVVIVAGFQGVSRGREITTLGRGGSDTTAVALAVAFRAERCDIYTDVDGVFTADPRRIPDARLIRALDYREMLELATSGAQVVHPRAVEMAARFGVPLRVLSSFRDDTQTGTSITNREQSMEDMILTGIATDGGFARLSLSGLPAGMHATTEVLRELSLAGISVDMVVQADRPDGHRELQLTVREAVLPEARALCERLTGRLGADKPRVRAGLTRIALVGRGMHGRPGVYARAYEALLAGDIEVHALSTSSVSITLLVDAAQEDEAVRRLHDAFALGAEPEANAA